MHYERIYDITLSLPDEVAPYPGDTPFSRELASSMEHGHHSDASVLTISSHAGTHLDSPAHFHPGGKSLDQFEIGRFLVPARMVDVPGAGPVEPVNVPGDLAPGAAVLFRTNNSTSGLNARGVFDKHFVYVSARAAEKCVALELSLVGIDAWSVDAHDDPAYPVHRALSAADVLVLENANLAGVPAGDYTLACFPLKIRGGEASPVRAVLLGRNP
ncbi:MAG: cyclase family protein [Desulfatibacillaceae bacterium]